MAVTKITNLEFGKMVQAAADKLGKNAEFINLDLLELTFCVLTLNP